MKTFCLTCFMNGRVKLLTGGACDDCGGRQGFIVATCNPECPRTECDADREQIICRVNSPAPEALQ